MDMPMQNSSEMSNSSSIADSSDSGPLSAIGLDLTNETTAFDYLGEILDDTDLQAVDNRYATYFWYGIIVAIAISVFFNALRQWKATLRLRAAAKNRPHPAQFSNIITKSVGSVTTAFRRATYPQITPNHIASMMKFPPIGTVVMLLVYLSFIMALEFVNNNVEGDQYYQALSLRAAWLTVAQIPLIVLLAGKNNIIGLLVGVSYERLNVLHRWVSRCLFLTVTMHFGFQSFGWNRLGLMQLEWHTDSCPPSGMGAYGVLLWIFLSTFAPFRNFSYEFFVVQHLITFFGFIIAVMYHIPSTALWARVYVWIPIGFYLLDRLIRTSRLIFNNARGSSATFVSLPDGATKISVKNRYIKHWAPGAYVLLSVPRFGIAQSHPATIASIPSSHNNDLVFILREHNGFTKRISKAARLSSNASSSSKEMSHAPAVATEDHVALVDGPYGASHSDFAVFDTTILIAGSTGVTFSLAILLDLAARASVRKLPLRKLIFVWAMRAVSCTEWVKNELNSAVQALHDAGIECTIHLHVTRGILPMSESSMRHAAHVPSKNGDFELDDSVPVKQDKSAEIITSSHSSTRSMSSLRQSTTDTLHSGRPDIPQLIAKALMEADGEISVGVCGPISLSASVRRVVASSDGGRFGIYLHAESFGW